MSGSAVTMGWRVTRRQNSRIAEYSSADGTWTLWSQPFTPVWHVRYNGRFIKDFTKVSEARRWAEAEGAAFVATHPEAIAAAPVATC